MNLALKIEDNYIRSETNFGLVYSSSNYFTDIFIDRDGQWVTGDEWFEQGESGFAQDYICLKKVIGDTFNHIKNITFRKESFSKEENRWFKQGDLISKENIQLNKDYLTI